MGAAVNYKKEKTGSGLVLNQFVLVKPTELYDARIIADHIRESRSVMLNTETLEDSLKRRILDFAAGFVYSCDGSVTRITDALYLIVPCGVNIDNETENEWD